MDKEIQLKVAEAIQDDVNKGIVRVDSNFMREIGVRPGDIVEIAGERKTVCIVDRAYPGDIGLNIVRIDGITRRNAKTGVGEMVKVKKADIKEAKRVTIAPAKKGIVVRASPIIFRHGLLGRALMKGDIVALGGTNRRKTAMSSNPFFDEIFEVLDEELQGGFGFGGFSDLKFIVADTMPKQAVFVTETTEVIFNPEAIELEKEERVPEVSYEDIGGLEEEIRKVREMIELPLKHPELFEKLGIEPPKGVLLHGPPGTGKTLLAKAVANETNSYFILINGPEIMSKYYGQSEENLRKKFEEAEKNAPSIIFIDEIDAIASKREETHGEVERRVVAQLLALMDGLQARGKVVVVAATNIPNVLDPALRRPGRFDREIEIGVPNKLGRLNILKIHTRNMPLDHWDTGAVAKLLKKKYTAFDEVANKRIENFKIKLENLESEQKVKQKEIIVLQRNIPETEAKKKEKLEEIAKLRARLAALEAEKSDKQKGIEKIGEHVAIVGKLRDEAAKNKRSIDILVKAITELKEDSTSLDTDDPRTIFAEEKMANLDEELRVKINQLRETGILSKEFIDEAKKESIPALLDDLASITHGFVGADVASLAKESAMVVLRKVLPDLKYDEDEKFPSPLLDRLVIRERDFKEALKMVRPSALREVLLETPNIKWNMIGGLDNVKQELKEAVEWPLKYPNSFKTLGVQPPRGILVYGAPGTGKTLLAKAVATESQANFIAVKGPEIISQWVGESEKAVRKIFEKARQAAPSIVFFDEIDAIATSRGVSSSNGHVTERVVNQLLTEIDGLQDLSDVVVIAATNRPDMLDTALLRPGRFDRIILTPAPDNNAREEIFKIHSKLMPLRNVNLKELADRTEGFTGADIKSLCREAAMLALRKDIKAKVVTMDHFEDALKKVYPSVSLDTEKSYEEIARHFSSARAKQMEQERPAYMG
ncbi:MAG: CDC48 family AAA ATPase [Candidatus Woesearchaeota archaeon]